MNTITDKNTAKNEHTRTGHFSTQLIHTAMIKTANTKMEAKKLNDGAGVFSIRALLSVLAMVGLFTLSACDSGKDTDLQDSIDTVGFTAIFNPDAGIIPFPNNLLFKDTADGTLNIPTDDLSAGEKATVDAVNALDGFSTTAPFSTTFTESIDSSTVIAGSSVRVFEVTLSGLAGAVVAINRELEGLAADGLNIATAEYAISLSSADSTNRTLAIAPLRPLSPNTSYMVALSKDIKNTKNENALPDFFYHLAKIEDSFLDGSSSTIEALDDEQAAALEPLRVLTNFAENTIVSYTITNDTGDAITDLAKADIILSWSFTTQSIGPVLSQLRTDLAGMAAPVYTPDSQITAGLPSGVGVAADFYKGSLQVPSFLDVTAPLTTSFQGVLTPASDNSPDVISSVNIPVLISVPKTAKPVTGWPTVIFQHGITRERSVMLGVADGLAAAGFAAVAIDMPLHGLAGSATAALLGVSGIDERNDYDIYTYDSNGNRTANSPDGTADPSGIHFINLTSLLTSRDNLKQSVADLYSLRLALDTMDYDNDGNNSGTEPDFDSSNLDFVGHSLGAMVGTVYVRFETNIQHAVLAMPGGGIAKLLDGSAGFGPIIAAGLAQNGVVKGTSDYETFMVLAQTVLDSADPINYASTLGAGSQGLLFLEITGDASNPSDLVIPNTVPDSNDTVGTVRAPLAGSTPLATFLGVQKTDASLTSPPDPLKAWVQFNKGHHGSVLTPNDRNGDADAVSAEVYMEMLSEITSFLGSNAQALTVTDDVSNDIIKNQ